MGLGNRREPPNIRLNDMPGHGIRRERHGTRQKGIKGARKGVLSKLKSVQGKLPQGSRRSL